MGTPPAPDWATLYFCIWEMLIIPQYPELALYRRYIDDGFGIWVPASADTAADATRFQLFTSTMSKFGINHQFFQSSPHEPLEWEFSDRTKSAVFLDLNITLKDDGSIHTSIYEKALNLYLYIPPHSCHAPGCTRGLIFGMVDRVKALCTDPNDYQPFLRKCLTRLLARGHRKEDILPIFQAAIASKITHPSTRRKKETLNESLMFHLRINPGDPSARGFQSLFRSTVAAPLGRDTITAVETQQAKTVDFNRLTICYHGQRNLKSTLSPRKGRFPPTFSVSNYFEELQSNN